MKSLLFIDHEYHRLTRSSDFFVKILSKSFDVETVYIEPESEFHGDFVARASRSDAVVLWQMDYLAPVFLALGVPTIVVPMYDGSSLMPDLHWLWGRKASFINFSLALHHRVRMLGGRSKLVKYFKPPVAIEKTARFDGGLRAFIWHRRPEHGINLHAVEKLFGPQLRSVHVHNAPDDPELDGSRYLKPELETYDLTVSTWFDNPAEYGRLLGKANVFIAPRRAEGIGLAMLEAMARGMLVVAADQPTHNEYIANWVNGVLINPDGIGHANFDRAAHLGQMAWRAAADGHETWLKATLDLPDFVRSAERPARASVGEVAEFGRALSRAYYLGLPAYRGYLVQNSSVIAAMAGVNLAGRVTEDANVRPAQPASKRAVAAATAPADPQRWLEACTLPVTSRTDHVVAGRLRIADGAAWVTGFAATLGFHIDPFSDLLQSATLDLHRPDSLPGPQVVLISLNDWTLGTIDLSAPRVTVALAIPQHVLKADNLLRVQCSVLGQAPQIGEPVSVGLGDVRFS